jgi:hypothetical protein
MRLTVHAGWRVAVYDGRHGGRGRVHEAVEADRMAHP